MFAYIGYRYYFDPTYILIIIGVIISLLAQAKVKTTFARYSDIRTNRNISGKEVAKMILQSQGIYDVTIGHIQGNLTDHYDPRSKTLNLSDSVYNSSSVAAAGVAAHECGHAIQHAKGYTPLQIRSMLVPIANFGSGISWFLIIIGIIINSSSSQFFLNAGIIAFSGAVLFQIITLPVETNASRRALAALSQTGLMDQDEIRGSRKVLGAAALTYVAAAAASILQLFRLILLFGGRKDD